MLNATEKLAKLLFDEVWDKAERFTYIAGETNPADGGASPRKVADSIRHKGVLNEPELPFDSSIQTLAQFNSPIPLTQALLDKAKPFLRDYEFRYDFLNPVNGVITREQLRAALYRSPVAIAVYAWAEKDGKYYRLDDDTHLTLLTNVKDNNELEVFDSYSPSHKTLSADFPIYTAIRVYLRKKTEEEKVLEEKKTNIILAIYQWMISVAQYIVNYRLEEKRALDEIAPKQPPQPEFIPDTPFIVEVPNSPSLTPKPPLVAPKESLVVPFAQAIQQMEGWFVGSRSYKNNNAGNLKYSTYTKSLGAIEKDKDGFCIFPDYAKGFSALCQFIIDAADNKLKLCKQCTIYSFCAGYAPASDKNQPKKYAEFIAQKLKVKPDVLLKDII